MNMHYVSCLVCGFNHPNPRGLGQRIEGGLPYRYKFQSSQPVRVGSNPDRDYTTRLTVSIIPTREGWVMRETMIPAKEISFNHPSPRGLGQYKIQIKFSVTCFNHPNPRGLGRSNICYSVQLVIVSIIPTREGWVR